MSKIKLEDLSAEDRESLLQEAKHLVDEELLRKNAKIMYYEKRKELIDSCIDEICNSFKPKIITTYNKTKLKERIAALVNFMYKNINNKSCNNKNSGSTVNILTTEEWELYKEILLRITATIISTKDIGKENPVDESK